MTINHAERLVVGLNPKQREAVLTQTLRTLVLAGAGSGKTRVLTHRIAKHLLHDRIPAQSVLALTFTNKAAKEMRTRLIDIVGNELGSTVFAGTFHSFCHRLLRRNYSLAGLSQKFTMLNDSDQKGILSDAALKRHESSLTEIKSKYKAGEYNEAEKDRLLNIEVGHYAAVKKAIKPILSIIDALKTKGMGYQSSYLSFVMDSKVGDALAHDAVALFKEYEDFKNKHSMLDFNDLLIKAILLLKEFSDLRNGLKDQFKAILVDEFQDTNTLQFAILKLILSPTCLLTVVGDEDQLIYEWRGAEIENILGFSKAKETNLIILDQNYRSTKTILAAANNVIARNEQRIGKNLWTENETGELINVHFSDNPFQEAEYVAEKVHQLHQQGVSLNDIVILYRNNSVSSMLERAFHQYRISSVVEGGVGFWARKEVKFVMAYLKWANDPSNALAIKHALSMRKCGYGDKTHLKLMQAVEKGDMTLEQALYAHCKKGAKSKNKELVLETIKLVERVRTAYNTNGLSAAIQHIINKSNVLEYFENLHKGDKEKYEERYMNIMAVLDVARTFKNDTLHDEVQLEDIEAFISSADLQINASKKEVGESVSMMTIHTSKGLEYKFVFLVGADQGFFPSFRNIEEDRLEEERRLAYVAITRAMKKLYITTSKTRLDKSTAGLSEFIRDIDDRWKMHTKSNRAWF